MKVLLDENLPRQLRRELQRHEVSTVTEAGWSGIRNGQLLALAEQEFDALVTLDSHIEFEQQLQHCDLGFVILHAVDNKVDTLRPLVPAILQALNHVRPGQIIHVPEQP